MTITQVYTPVTHKNGELNVQVTNQNGDLLGWADGRGKYDLTGTWEISEKWHPSQAGELGNVVAKAKENGCRVTVQEKGITRIVIMTI